ncbi:hypothetical protein B0T24DRAFT_683430 [Lasiosphaeria ovina]|uniref:Non-structural maintenance of chromosome element 4 C-terminal domain-containing protein n=1 Tax=Lasiosphaeria ovina TaxID=92902 RepID=A0AAE0JVF6_9PEZI|nr:hypothetical protein B0T24DRAFT_683430 [Lasiosphaeria ovina]
MFSTVCPNECGQTVENMFYISFLILEGSVKLDFDKDGFPEIAAAAADIAARAATNAASAAATAAAAAAEQAEPAEPAVPKVRLDDYIIVLAWLISMFLSATIDVGTRRGLGRHDENNDPKDKPVDGRLLCLRVGGGVGGSGGGVGGSGVGSSGGVCGVCGVGGGADGITP